MEGLNNRTGFVQENSPDGDFLQSREWRKFQEAVGRRTFYITSPQPSPYKGEGDLEFSASIIEHKLPVVGKYFYIPRGPIFCHSELDSESIRSRIKSGMTLLLDIATKENAGWIRIEPNDKKILEIIKNIVGAGLASAQKGQTQGLSLRSYKIAKAPHDMQPREILILDIIKSEEELLAEMKAKTRYNIKVAQKHGVLVKVISNITCHPERSEGSRINVDGANSTGFLADAQNDRVDRFFNEFIRLVKITAERDKIAPHPESYYRKMFETIPPENIKLYAAEYDNKIIAANIVIFYGNTATYLHGASDYNYRDAMAPYLLQWQAIKDAKEAGLIKYDLGGISTNYESSTNIQITNNWRGITRFKLGFAPNTKPVEFPGSYDIVINSFKYNIYRILQKIKSLF